MSKDNFPIVLFHYIILKITEISAYLYHCNSRFFIIFAKYLRILFSSQILF